MGNPPLRSMTGFASIEGRVAGFHLKMEMRSLNHRFLDIKLRIPRDFSNWESKIRGLVQESFSRGSIELKMEILDRPEEETATFEPNLTVAASYYESLRSLQKTLGLQSEIRFSDLMACPEIIERNLKDEPTVEDLEKVWVELQTVISSGIGELQKMRAQEGSAIQGTFKEALEHLKDQTKVLRGRRTECEEDFRKKTEEKIKKVFEANPISDNLVESILESRIAQELALILDKTDIEEELNRLEGHVGLFLNTLKTGSPIGRKLDFILQEINREVNTLGNKAQDFQISENVVQLKVKTEQLREQVMNVE